MNVKYFKLDIAPNGDLKGLKEIKTPQDFKKGEKIAKIITTNNAQWVEL